MTFCCETMKNKVQQTCPANVHTREECPDCVLDQWSNGTIGIMVKDGGSSLYVFDYCPWCGTNIKVKRWTKRHNKYFLTSLNASQTLIMRYVKRKM